MRIIDSHIMMHLVDDTPTPRRVWSLENGTHCLELDGARHVMLTVDEFALFKRTGKFEEKPEEADGWYGGLGTIIPWNEEDGRGLYCGDTVDADRNVSLFYADVDRIPGECIYLDKDDAFTLITHLTEVFGL